MDKKVLLEQILKYFKVKDIPEKLGDLRKLYKEQIMNCNYLEVPENILLLEDKYLRLELINKKLVDSEKYNTIDTNLEGKYKHGDKVALLEGDISSVYADVLINPVNAKFDYGDNLLLNAGLRLRKKCHDILDGKELNPTEILITRAFNLLSDYLVHVVLPTNEDINEYITELGMCYFNVLECSNNNIAKIVVVRDICDNPKIEKSKEILLNSIMDYLDREDCHLEKIVIVASKDDDFEQYVELLDNYKETTE